jgi:hypothetical protein
MEDIYLLHGNIASGEVPYVRNLLETKFVFEVKKNEPETDRPDGNVQVVFKKYDTVTFQQGFKLIDTLQPALRKMQSVLSYYSSTGKAVTFIAVDIAVYYKFKSFSLLIIASPEEFVQGLDIVDSKLISIAEEVKQDDCIKIKVKQDEPLEIVNCNRLKDMYTVIRDSSI